MRGAITERYSHGRSRLAIVNLNGDKVNVNDWNPSNRNDNVGLAPVVVSSFYWLLSILQASCLLLEGWSEVLSNLYLLLPDCLLPVSTKLWQDQALYLSVAVFLFYCPNKKLKTRVQTFLKLGCLVSAPVYSVLF